MTTVRANEGLRVLRNVASFGSFLFSPLHMALLSRALGEDGYGRWWSAFVVLEAASILGMLGAELYVRKEVPRLVREGAREDEILAVIGSGLAVVVVAGAVLLGLQLVLAHSLATSRGDPALVPFLVVLSVIPLMWNIATVLGAALQSRDVLGPLAILRGLVMPLILSGMLYAAWREHLATGHVLYFLVGVTFVGLASTVVLYARHFSLRRTLANVASPRRVRQVLRYGFGLFVPAVLITLGGKLDLYVLGDHVAPSEVGVYAACLQMASMLPNTRAIFDPVSQAQIGALHGVENAELAASLRRLARLCALAMAPSVVFLVAVGQPIMAWLLGHPVTSALVPLVILCAGQFIGNLAVSAWLVPMTMPGRVLALVAAVTLASKLALLLLLVPRYGLIGAAIATAVGTIVPLQGQAWLGARRLGHRVYSAGLIPVLGVSFVCASGSRMIYAAYAADVGSLEAALLAIGAGFATLVVALPFLLTRAERGALRGWLRRRR